jgi:hypothetical protein
MQLSKSKKLGIFVFILLIITTLMNTNNYVFINHITICSIIIGLLFFVELIQNTK